MAAAEMHGKRQDRTGPARQIIDTPPLTTRGLNISELYEKHIEGAALHKSSTKCLHALIQFPAAIFDPTKPKIMLDLANKFASEVFGDKAVFTDRLDRDEMSKHVVDLFIAPKYEKQTKHSSKTAISTTVHLKKLAEKHGKAPTLRGQGQALQDEFFEFLQREGFSLVQRGSKKTRKEPDRQEPEALEAKKLETLQKALHDALEPPTGLDLIRARQFFDRMRERVLAASEQLLAMASELTKERALRLSADERARDALQPFLEAELSEQDMKARAFYRDSYAAQLSAANNRADRYEDKAAQFDKLASRTENLEASLTKAEVRATTAERLLAATKEELSKSNADLAVQKGFVASVRLTLKRVLGSTFEAVRLQINDDWKDSPANPERENDQASRYSSGPSPG